MTCTIIWNVLVKGDLNHLQSYLEHMEVVEVVAEEVAEEYGE